MSRMTSRSALHPDSELIHWCEQYRAAVIAFNADPDAGDPLWAAIERAEAEVDARPPVTLAGVRAKAAVALATAQDGPEGESWHGAPCDWAAAVVRDVLRLVAEGVA